jgi:endonuclease YncB( thermonuclease family)
MNSTQAPSIRAPSAPARPRPGLESRDEHPLRLLLTVVLVLVVLFPGARPAAASQSDEAVVTAALSGSVIAVRDSSGTVSPVHYVGVESPADGQRFHAEAREANAALVVGKRVLLRRAGRDRLADGARVRHVFVLADETTAENPGHPIAATLLADGQVWRVTDAHDLDPWFRELEAGARLSRGGLWAHYAPVPNPEYFGSLPAVGTATLLPRRPPPALGISPAPFGTPWFGVRVEHRAYPSMAALVELGDPWSWVIPVLRDHGVQVLFAQAPHIVGGYFSPDMNLVAINARFAESDPRAVAAAIVHESVHVRDYYAGEPVRTLEGCFQTEIRAYHAEAEAWLSYYGPGGKQPAADDLEQLLNDLTLIYRTDRPLIEQAVRRVYERQCVAIASR